MYVTMKAIIENKFGLSKRLQSITIICVSVLFVCLFVCNSLSVFVCACVCGVCICMYMCMCVVLSKQNQYKKNM